MSGKCEAGIELPEWDQPCRACGSAPSERCGKAVVSDREKLAALPGLVKALEEIEQMPLSMVNDSESLRFIASRMGNIAHAALLAYRSAK